MKKSKKSLSIFSAILCLFTCLTSCASDVAPTYAEQNETRDIPSSVTLGATDDMGKDYIDSFIFFGESTTYHLKSRGVLSGGKNTTQVWAPSSGTVNLDSTTASVKILYPETGEYLTLSEAAAKKKPKYMLLCFGLNGAARNIRLGKDYYISCYRSLLDAISSASPDTKLILQSGYPVASNMDMSAYSCDARELNGYISTLNGWTRELAEEYGAKYLNTSEVLTDSDGFLKSEYQNGDGHHMTVAAYKVILEYIRTHGYV